MPASTAICERMKSAHLICWRRWEQEQYQSDVGCCLRLIGDLVTEILQCSGDAIVSPAAILTSHADNKISILTPMGGRPG
jgi:hypothetical protein